MFLKFSTFSDDFIIPVTSIERIVRERRPNGNEIFIITANKVHKTDKVTYLESLSAEEICSVVNSWKEDDSKDAPM